MSLKKFVFSLLFISMATSGYTQTGKPKPAVKAELPAPVKGAKSSNTLLWQISGKGLKEPSYLYGTMHIVCAEDAKLSDSL